MSTTDLFKPLSRYNLADVGDYLARVTGRICISPLEIGLMLGWVEAGIPIEAVRRGFRRFKRYHPGTWYPRPPPVVECPGHKLEEYIVDAYEEMKGEYLGSH